VTRALWRVMGQPQSDPELERLRQEVWRRYRRTYVWMVGFPIFCLGVMALVIATGFVRLVA
jgi:hypothetical protein